MTSLPNPTHPASHRTRIIKQFGVRLFVSFALGATTVALSWFAAGPGLGVYFGTVLLASLVCPFLASMPSGTGVPPVLLAQEHGPDAGATEILRPGLIALFLWFGITVGWCISLSSPDVSFLNIALCLIVLGAYLGAIAGVVSALRRLGVPPILSGAFTALLCVAWLTWPVWLSGFLSSPHGEAIAGWFVPFDLLMAINSILKQFGAWDHAYSIAYNHLTTLNQDAPYRMPTTIFPSVLFHAIVALAGFFVAARKSSSAPAR